MLAAILRNVGIIVGVFTAVAVFSTPPLVAQSKNPIAAAKDALRRAKEQQQQQKEKAQQPPPAPPTQTTAPQAAVPQTPALGDCCSPEALTKIASSAGFIDIVGIKLGMTPEQAFAAVKAFNPQMKIDIVKTRMVSPDAPGQFTTVPQFAVAHTVGKPRFPNTPVPFTLADGSADVIVIEFTVPPSPAFVGKVVRQTTFPTGQPVTASNLVEALHKKYGQELFSDVGLVWVFDVAGKPITRPLQGPERFCAASAPFDGFGWQGEMPVSEVTRDSSNGIDLSTTREQDNTARSEACRGIAFASSYPLGEATPRNQQMNLMTVTIQSGPLLYGSRKAVHDWLQAKGDAKAKEQQDAAKARPAPKL